MILFPMEELTRFCTSCQFTKPTKGGITVIIRGGRSTRWKCESCKKTGIENKSTGELK